MLKTIVAQSTPSGQGAIALIRVSGFDARVIVSKCARLSTIGGLVLDVQTHTIHHGWIVNSNNDIIDEVMFFIMDGPRTFTGENTIEITCHNNKFIIGNIINRLLFCGAVCAGRGDFIQQAILNNKLDLIQAESINELINATSNLSIKQALAQLRGTLSSMITDLEVDLLNIISLCEASFEFLEEDIDFSKILEEKIVSLLHKVLIIKQSFNQQRLLREGVRIALIGAVNAGKSSLFNALISRNRAIVTDIPGTTRDVIEAFVESDNGISMTLIDTAGLRLTDDSIEYAGIGRSYDEAKNADIILLVFDGSRIMTSEEELTYSSIIQQYNEKILILINKSDLENNGLLSIQRIIDNYDFIFVSVNDNISLARVKLLIDEKISKIFTYFDTPFILNQRQIALLTTFEQKLMESMEFLIQPCSYELIALYLNEAGAALFELTGKSMSEKTLESIFKNFCIGK